MIELFPNEKPHTDYHWTVAKGRHLDLDAVANLSLLILRIEEAGYRALIVLSSAWRNDATLSQFTEQVFSHHFFSKYLCGKTPPEKDEIHYAPECADHPKERCHHLANNRPAVIKLWLQNHGFDPNSTNYIVFDDDKSKMVENFESRFIPVAKFLDNEVTALAFDILLSKTALEKNKIGNFFQELKFNSFQINTVDRLNSKEEWVERTFIDQTVNVSAAINFDWYPPICQSPSWLLPPNNFSAPAMPTLTGVEPHNNASTIIVIGVLVPLVLAVIAFCVNRLFHNRKKQYFAPG